MCGFAGFIGPPGAPEQLEAIAEAMGLAIAHRGPDSSGGWTDAAAGFAVNHRRLAIIDVSERGHQPMHSASGRYVIAFNGEIYNFLDIRDELQRCGTAPVWRGGSDTEVLLAAIEAWGIDGAIERSAGMFAFAVWDREQKSLSLARDRLGEKPLYYGWMGGTFLFGSDLAALRKHPAWKGEVDRDALQALLRFAYVPPPLSIYRDIKKLEPGSLMQLQAGSSNPKIERFWSVTEAWHRAAADPFSGSPEEAMNSAANLIDRSVRQQMIADVPLGCFLSGGIDSSLVAAMMQSASSRPIKTFTIGFDEAAYDEAKDAEAVARHLGTEHHELYLSAQSALDVVPKLSAIYSEPFADASQIPAFLVSKLARQSVTVALSGDGGDEVFSGYDRYRIADGHWQSFSRLPRFVREGASRVLSGAATGAVMRMPVNTRLLERTSKLADVLAADSVAAAYDKIISHWPHPERIVIQADKFSGAAGWPGDSHADPVRAMMLADLAGYLPGDILVKVDRAAMATSLETRVPFLDHRLVEFSLRLPRDIYRRGGVSKWLTRELLARFVPRRLFERKKAGFSVPLADWLRGPLRPWAEDLLSRSRLQRDGYFHPEPIRAAWDHHVAGKRNAAHALWTILMFQSWLDSERSGTG